MSLMKQIRNAKKTFLVIMKILAGSVLAASVMSSNFVIAREVENKDQNEKIKMLDFETVMENQYVDTPDGCVDDEETNEKEDKQESTDLGEADEERNELESSNKEELDGEKKADDKVEDVKDDNSLQKDSLAEESKDEIGMKESSDEENDSEEIPTEEAFEEITLEEDMDLEQNNMCEGVCGDEVVYSFLPESGKLILSGSGQVYDYENTQELPWGTYYDDMESVEIEEGVTVKLWMINKKSAKRVGKYKK